MKLHHTLSQNQGVRGPPEDHERGDGAVEVKTGAGGEESQRAFLSAAGVSGQDGCHEGEHNGEKRNGKGSGGLADKEMDITVCLALFIVANRWGKLQNYTNVVVYSLCFSVYLPVVLVMLLGVE